MRTRKMWIKRAVGDEKVVEPPENTPLWAISNEWLERNKENERYVSYLAIYKIEVLV